MTHINQSRRKEEQPIKPATGYADITKEEDNDKMIAVVEDDLGKLDIICNIAGSNDLCYTLEDTINGRYEGSIQQHIDSALTDPCCFAGHRNYSCTQLLVGSSGRFTEPRLD